jgi:hypothetical protein
MVFFLPFLRKNKMLLGRHPSIVSACRVKSFFFLSIFFDGCCFFATKNNGKQRTRGQTRACPEGIRPQGTATKAAPGLSDGPEPGIDHRSACASFATSLK